jgi:hypothetical protein
MIHVHSRLYNWNKENVLQNMAEECYTQYGSTPITPAVARMTFSLFIVTSLKMDDCRFYTSRSKRFSSSPNHPDSLRGPQSLLFNGFYQWLLHWH